jgi:hypothetical protein
MMSTAPGPSTARAPVRHRGLFWLTAVIATFALIGGTFLAVTSYLSSAQPGDVVESYFAALERGDASRALSYGPVPAGDHGFLTEDVLKAQLAIAAIENVQVLSVTRSGTTAKVNVSYQLRANGIPGSSQLVTDAVPMIRKDRHWWLAASAVSTKVGLAQAGQRATFAGTTFPSGEVLMFPGALPIKFDTANLQLGNADSTVRFSDADNSGLTVEASGAGIGAARAALGVALTACLAGTSTDPFCPVPGNGSSVLRAVPGSLRGILAAKATDGLTVTVTPDANGVFHLDGTVSVDGKYQSLDYTNIASSVTDGHISVSISAQSYASSVDAITWKSP